MSISSIESLLGTKAATVADVEFWQAMDEDAKAAVLRAVVGIVEDDINKRLVDLLEDEKQESREMAYNEGYADGEADSLLAHERELESVRERVYGEGYTAGQEAALDNALVEAREQAYDSAYAEGKRRVEAEARETMAYLNELEGEFAKRYYIEGFEAGKLVGRTEAEDVQAPWR